MNLSTPVPAPPTDAILVKDVLGGDFRAIDQLIRDRSRSQRQIFATGVTIKLLLVLGHLIRAHCLLNSKPKPYARLESGYLWNKSRSESLVAAVCMRWRS
jgi:hypothetical protein